MIETLYLVKREDWSKTYTTLEGATKALNVNSENELFEYILNNKNEKRASKLLAPIKEDIENFTEEILQSVNEDDDMDRATAKLFYAMSIKSFAGDGNWRRHIVRCIKWLRAVREKEEKKETEEAKPAKDLNEHKEFFRAKEEYWVMLPTENKSEVGSLVIREVDKKICCHNELTEFHGKNQHLYLVSDDKPKEGDWVITPENEIIGWAKVLQPIGKKIIATTDKLYEIPRIPQDFVKEFAKKQGKVGEVHIEFDEGQTITRPHPFQKGARIVDKLFQLKLTDDKEIIIL